jgi:hypothetical protein
VVARRALVLLLRRVSLFPLGWFVAGFVLFSLSSGKRGAYLLPLYPAAALLVGRLWDRALEIGARERWVAVPLAILSGAAALIALGLALVPRHLLPGRMVHTLVPAEAWQRAAAGLLVLAGAGVVWWLWRRRRPAATLAALVTVQATVLLTVAVVRAPQYEAEYPVRVLAAGVHAAVPPDHPVLSLLYDYDNIVAFYVDRPILPFLGPSELLAARIPVKPRFGLIDNNDLDEMLAMPAVHPLAEWRLGPRRVLLIRLE